MLLDVGLAWMSWLLLGILRKHVFVLVTFVSFIVSAVINSAAYETAENR